MAHLSSKLKKAEKAIWIGLLSGKDGRCQCSRRFKSRGVMQLNRYAGVVLAVAISLCLTFVGFAGGDVQDNDDGPHAWQSDVLHDLSSGGFSGELMSYGGATQAPSLWGSDKQGGSSTNTTSEIQPSPPVTNTVLSSTPAGGITSWSPPTPHFFLRIGGDAVLGGLVEIGPGLTGYWGEEHLLAEVFFTGNFDFVLAKTLSSLGGEAVAMITAVLEGFSLSQIGEAMGVGTRFRWFTHYSPERGAHGYGAGLGLSGVISESSYGTTPVIMGEAVLSASWPLIEANVYYRMPFWALKSAGSLMETIKKGSIGVTFGLRDPLGALIEAFGAIE